MWDKQWLKQFPEVTFAPKEKIIQMDEPLLYNYYLIDGICARIYPSAEGRDIIFRYYQSGKMLGIYLSQFSTNAALELIAKTTCRCLKIPQESIFKILKEDNDICYTIMKDSIEENDYLSTLLIAKTLGGGISLLCLVLKSLAIPQANKTALVHPLFTNVELSNYCGIHVVSISRLLSKLTHEGILERTKEGIVIYNMERLSDYIKLGE